jgi:hypothetical protein
MRRLPGIMRLTAHTTILTAAWVAVLGALVFNSYFMYADDDSRDCDF